MRNGLGGAGALTISLHHKMAEYNERFSFSDPFADNCINRTTRYRLRKKRIAYNELKDDYYEQTASDEGGESEGQEVFDSVFDDYCFDHEIGEVDDLKEELDIQSNDVYCVQLSHSEIVYMDYPHLDFEVDPTHSGPNDSDDADSSDDDQVTRDQHESQASAPITSTSNADSHDHHIAWSQIESGPHCTSGCTSVQQIYEGSSLNIDQSNILIKKFMMRHGLSKAGLRDLLQLIQLHCPRPNTRFTSIFKFNQRFGKPNIEFHYFCSYCLEAVTDVARVCEGCNKEVVRMNGRPELSCIEVQIYPQLERILRRNWNVITEVISKRQQQHDSRQHSAASIEDILEGKLYCELLKLPITGAFVTLIFNTDGIPVFKSSKFCFWPMYLSVNELPYRLRIRKENRIFAGLWYGSSKPDMAVFLRPLAESLQCLAKDGVNVSLSNGDSYNYKALLLCCAFDLPAKAAVLNINQFNGYYGCCRCMQQGKSVRASTAGRGMIRVYPYMENSSIEPKRSHKETMQHAEKAVSTKSMVWGIKGFSWLSTVPTFDVIRGTTVDYMHCVLLGVTRQLLKLWFNSCNHKEVWYIGTRVAEVDERLLLVKPPEEIERTPRSIQSTVKFWKAHELRAWLLHYSSVVLYNILLSEYHQHHLLLVEGIFLLLKDCVTIQDIQQSTALLNHYCFMFAVMYGERNMTMNIHSLLHLPDVVNDLGPLWGHSCFPFESANGDLLKVFHGSQSIEKQVVYQLYSQAEVDEMAALSIATESKEYDFYSSMLLQGKYSRKSKFVISDNHVLIGSPKIFTIATSHESSVDLAFIKANVSMLDRHLFVYPCLLISSKRRYVSCELQSRYKKRNNCCVQYEGSDSSSNYGILRTLVVSSKELPQTMENSVCFAVIRRLEFAPLLLCKDEVTHSQLNQHLFSCHPSNPNNLCIVPATSIVDKVVLMEVQEKLNVMFVSVFPNSKENE